jgi:glycosyltransferase involved in cell wall biosynthesis
MEMLRRIDHENKKGMHKITYLGALKHTDMVEWYQEASIFVLPSFREGFPVANLEALSCETPVISTNIGGISEAVRDGESGILVPSDNALRLAEAIQYLLDNEGARLRLGREGRKQVIGNFSHEVIVRRLCSIYEKLLR